MTAFKNGMLKTQFLSAKKMVNMSMKLNEWGGGLNTTHIFHIKKLSIQIVIKHFKNKNNYKKNKTNKRNRYQKIKKIQNSMKN